VNDTNVAYIVSRTVAKLLRCVCW